MKDWEVEDSDNVQPRRVRYFNKEKFCKKNRIGKGQYGHHIYVNDRCQYCGKIDPRVKHRSNGDLNNE